MLSLDQKLDDVTVSAIMVSKPFSRLPVSGGRRMGWSACHGKQCTWLFLCILFWWAKGVGCMGLMRYGRG